MAVEGVRDRTGKNRGYSGKILFLKCGAKSIVSFHSGFIISTFYMLFHTKHMPRNISTWVTFLSCVGWLGQQLNCLANTWIDYLDPGE